MMPTENSSNVAAAPLAKIQILSLFPQVIESVMGSSILRRAQVKGIVELGAGDLRDFSVDKYKSVDDAPFGGKQGMLMALPVLERALKQELAQVQGRREDLRVIFTSPRGVRAEQPVFESLAKWLLAKPARRVTVVCGRYEGVDERFVERWVDLELSLGDFILTGGELPALVVTDALVRLLPGVLGNEMSRMEESFSNGLLEYPQYTRPREFEGHKVPEILTQGHHQKSEEWQLRQSLLLTAAFRPDLIRAHSGEGLPRWAFMLLEELKKRIDIRA